MQIHLKARMSLIFMILLMSGSRARGADVDCSKFTQSLCNSLTLKENADTLNVNIFVKLPSVPRDDQACKDVDLRANPNSPCNDLGYDSAFWAKLKTETESLYSKYGPMMNDAKNPTQKLAYPGDSIGAFLGAVVTKTDLLTISQDSLVITAESWFDSKPAIVIYRQSKTNLCHGCKVDANEFDLNGKKLGENKRAFIRLGFKILHAP